MFSPRQNQRKIRQRAKITSSGRGRVKKNRRNKDGLWQSVKAANQRAQQRSNQRTYKRRGLRSIRAAIADGVIDDYSLPTAQLILRSLIGIFLLFPCFISTVALFNIDSAANLAADESTITLLLKSPAFLFFGVGSFLMVGWFFSGLLNGLFLYLYVLGHELTHAFFIYLCGGRISEFKVTKQGGHVVTNKTNILIALSPYFVPFWSVIILVISLIIKCFATIQYHDEALYLFIGATWTFHLCWTLWMIPRDQPDLKENGTFFSLTIIYLANVLLLAILLCLATEELGLKNYCYQWINLSIENGIAIKEWFISFL